MRDVIGADQDDDDRRIGAIEGAILDAPQQMLGSVARDAQVAHPQLAEEALEDASGGHSYPPTFATPGLRDGVADQQ